MSSSRWLMGAIVVALWWAAQAAIAQSAAGPAAVDIDPLLTQLIDGSDDYAVAQARRQIVAQLRDPNVAANELAARTSQVIARLPQALDDRKPEVVRINAVLVAAALNDPQVVALLDRALHDSHEAVRLRGALGMVQVAERIKSNNLVAQEQWSRALDAMLAVLSGTQQEEKSGLVLQATFAAMSKLLDADADRATPIALEALRKRAAQRLEQPYARMSAELECLKTIFRSLIQQAQGGAGEADLRRLAVISFRYLDVSAAVLQADQTRAQDDEALDAQSLYDYQQMILLTDTAIGWSIEQIAPQLPKLEALPANATPMDARLRAEAWRAALQGSAIKVPADELRLTVD